MKLKILLSIFLIINIGNANAQLDSTRIKTFNDKLQIGLFISDNNAVTTFQAVNSDNIIRQQPILKPTLGVQFAYNGAILALGTGVAIPHPRYEDYEITDAININGYLSRPKYVLWGAFRYFQGFEYSEGHQKLDYPHFVNAAASYMHIFNENKYSFRAAYRQADQQLKSGGSPLVKVTASYNSVHDTSLTVINYRDFRGFLSQGVSVYAGYGYTLNFDEHWFISALALGGVDFQKSFSGEFHSFLPTYDFKSSIGYNTDKFYFSLLFSTDNRVAINHIKEVNIVHQYFKTDLRFGIRIDAPKVLTKIKFLN